MLMPTRNVKRTFRDVITIVLSAFLLYGLYCRSSSINFSSLYQKSKILHSSNKCKLKWNNPKVSFEFYEAHRQTFTKEELEKLLSKLKPVKSLYPNPVIRLNPDKFLLPVVYNGPNNQITGLREAVFVAIQLNRTLVIPKFFKHFSDNSATREDWFIFPGHRLSIEDFCKFVSCVTIQQFQTACGHKVDALMHLQTFTPGDIQKWESYFGMKIARTESDWNGVNVKLIPPDPLKKGERHRKFKPKDIETLFTSKERCVLYPRPLYNLQIHTMATEKNNNEIELVKKQEDIYRLEDSKIFLSICNASGSPRYIMHMAKEFTRIVLKKRPFLSVHWRYNKEDFMKRCNSHEGNKLKMELCENAMQIKPEDISGSIEQKIQDIQRNYPSTNIRNVYIASPPTEKDLIAEIAKILRDKHGWLTFSSSDVEIFMHKRYSNCGIMEDHFNDILSTTEMEICRLGTAFLGSIRSSWSANVQLARKAQRIEGTIPAMDGDVYKMSVSIMQQQSEEEQPDEDNERG